MTLVTDECTCPQCGYDPVELSDPAMCDERIVIALTGSKGVGKSTIANYLIEQHGFKRIKFATALKDMLRTFLAYRGVPDDVIERMIEGDLKEVSHAALNGKSPRWAMQSLGTQWGRECMHPDLWVDTERDHLPSWGRFVCDDCRFENERQMIKDVGGVVVQVVRSGHVVTDGHESEAYATKLVPDYVCVNSGTMDDLREDADRFMGWIVE